MYFTFVALAYNRMCRCGVSPETTSSQEPQQDDNCTFIPGAAVDGDAVGDDTEVRTETTGKCFLHSETIFNSAFANRRHIRGLIRCYRKPSHYHYLFIYLE